MVAAMLRQDDRFLGWLQIVAEIRYTTELCVEYQTVLPYEALFQLRDHVYLQYEVFKHASLMVEDTYSKLAAGVRYSSSKICRRWMCGQSLESGCRCSPFCGSFMGVYSSLGLHLLYVQILLTWLDVLATIPDPSDEEKHLPSWTPEIIVEKFSANTALDGPLKWPIKKCGHELGSWMNCWRGRS